MELAYVRGKHLDLDVGCGVASGNKGRRACGAARATKDAERVLPRFVGAIPPQTHQTKPPPTAAPSAAKVCRCCFCCTFSSALAASAPPASTCPYNPSAQAEPNVIKAHKQGERDEGPARTQKLSARVAELERLVSSLAEEADQRRLQELPRPGSLALKAGASETERDPALQKASWGQWAGSAWRWAARWPRWKEASTPQGDDARPQPASPKSFSN